MARESESDLDIGTSLRVLGHALSLTNTVMGASAKVADTEIAEPGNPEQCFAESLAVFRKIQAEVEQARTLRAWAQHDLRQGWTAESQVRLAEASVIFEKVGALAEAAETENLLQERAG